MAPLFAIIRYALLETFFCIPILPKTKTAHHNTGRCNISFYYAARAAARIQKNNNFDSRFG